MPGVDLAGALARVRGNRGLVLRMLGQFVEEFERAPARLEQLLADGVAVISSVDPIMGEVDR